MPCTEEIIQIFFEPNVFKNVFSRRRIRSWRDFINFVSVFHGIIIGRVEESGDGTLRDAYCKVIVDKKKKKKFPDMLGKSPLGGESLEMYSHGTSLKPRNLSDDKAKGVTKKKSMLCSIFLENAHQNKTSTLLKH